MTRKIFHILVGYPRRNQMTMKMLTIKNFRARLRREKLFHWYTNNDNASEETKKWGSHLIWGFAPRVGFAKKILSHPPCTRMILLPYLDTEEAGQWVAMSKIFNSLHLWFHNNNKNISYKLIVDCHSYIFTHFYQFIMNKMTKK